MTVDELITCSKSIERKRKPTFKEDYRHYKANIPLSCSIQGIKMTMFLRRLKDLPEDFSVGLKLDGPNEFMEYDIVLVRFQGPHGGQSADKSLTSLHNAYHIHEYTQEDLSCRRKRASYKGDGNFSSFEEAIMEKMHEEHRLAYIKDYQVKGHEDISIDYAFLGNGNTRPIYLFGVKDTNKAQQTAINCLNLTLEKVPHCCLVMAFTSFLVSSVFLHSEKVLAASLNLVTIL